MLKIVSINYNGIAYASDILRNDFEIVAVAGIVGDGFNELSAIEEYSNYLSDWKMIVDDFTPGNMNSNDDLLRRAVDILKQHDKDSLSGYYFKTFVGNDFLYNLYMKLQKNSIKCLKLNLYLKVILILRIWIIICIK